METVNMLLFGVIYFTSIVNFVASTDCEFSIDALVTKGEMCVGDPLWTTKTSDVRECAVTCIRRKLCAVFTYDMETGRCDLYDQSGYLSPSTNNIVSSSIATWPNQIDPNCYDRPCKEDEVCIPGILAGGSSCSYMCMKMAARCPLIEGITSTGPRTVGTNITFTCEAGYRGQDSVTCLPSLQWDREINTTCTLLYDSKCNASLDCEDINGVCEDEKCQCPGGMEYKTDQRKCVLDCDSNWVNFENGCYLFDTANMASNKARIFCRDNDSHIVQVDTVAEAEFIKNKLRQDAQAFPSGMNLSYWIDLTQTMDDRWTWTTSREELDPNVSDWGINEPSDTTKDCAVFSSSLNWKWASEHCFETAKPICEKNQNP